MPVQDINSALYNAITQNFGLKSVSFILFQPANPVLDTGDLWNHYFNLIPAKSLLFNPTLSPGAQFFDNYCALNNALRSTPFQAPLEIRKAFRAFLRAQAAPPSLSQYPTIFRDWAAHKFPPLVATAAATAMSLALRDDPVADGQFRLMPYLGDPSANPPVPPKQPDWTGTFEQLQQLLAAGPPLSFKYRHSEVSKDISSTWSRGRSINFGGLTASGDLASKQSLLFAAGDFTVEASFAHVCTFAAAPGPWFSPVTMAIAYRNKDKAPWVPGNPVTWESTFDDDTGDLARFLVNVIAVDTMNIRITSFAKFTQDDQTVIRRNSLRGVWPFYIKPDARRIFSSTPSFTSTGQMEITTTSQPGVSIIIGGTIVSAGAKFGLE
jgi:hypothetical protein